MKIILIGGNGTIGKRVNEELSKTHEVLIAGRNSGQFQVDISDSNSIQKLYEKTGLVDAIICIAGDAKWANHEDLSEDDYYIGIKSKMMGQVNLSRLGLKYLNPGGSITLTSGILAEHPVPMTSSAAMVNGAIHSFVKALALETKEGKRINVVAAALVEDSAEKYAAYFKGQPIVSMKEVADAYKRSVEAKYNGEVIKVYKF